MNLNAKFSKEIIYSLYEDNKNYAIPVLSIVISFLLFFIFIVPQVLTFPNRKQEVDIENAKLSKIKEAEKSRDFKEVEVLQHELQKTAEKLN